MIKNIAVVFGGRSCEHEISILSAMQVMAALKDRYRVIAIYLSKDAHMYSSEDFKELDLYADMNQLCKKKEWVTLQRMGQEVYCVKGIFHKEVIDFVIPVLHGTNGEDGALQGWLALLDIPHSGSSLLACALAQSKLTSKALLMHSQIKTLDYHVLDAQHRTYKWMPCIIKPDRLGSSIGIQIVHEPSAWDALCTQALLYDARCVVEPYIASFRELNCALMRRGNEVVCSRIEEVLHAHEMLSFQEKYEGTQCKGAPGRVLDPNLLEGVAQALFEMAKKVYNEFHFEGVIRIDFMLIDDVLYVNEINTTPGSYAYYLWDDKNMALLLEEAIEEGMRAYQREVGHITTFDSNVLFHYRGGKCK